MGRPGSKTCIFPGFRVKMLPFSFKMLHFSFKMASLSFKMVICRLQWQIWPSKRSPARIWRKTARLPLSGIKNSSIFELQNGDLQAPMANLNFQRVSGQDLAENGSFAFKPHKEFIKKNAAVVLENLASKIVKMLQNGRLQRQKGQF